MIEVLTKVRFVAGPHNGWQGIVTKLCDSYCAVEVMYDSKRFEVVADLRHLQPLADWAASKSETERNLKGNPA